MTGVEILNQETIYNTILPEWCGIIALAGLVICIIPLAISLAEGKVVSSIIVGILMIGAIIVMALGLSHNKDDINYIKYKVTIDDSVSMNEFMDKYEILDQEGKIYTVKEREK